LALNLTNTFQWFRCSSIVNTTSLLGTIRTNERSLWSNCRHFIVREEKLVIKDH